MTVHIANDADAAGCKAAQWLAQHIQAAVAARGVCMLALSGGRTPVRMFRELAQQAVPWESVHLFQVDERIAPGVPDMLNRTCMYEHLIRHIGMPANQLHTFDIDAVDLPASAVRYSDTLQEMCGNPPVFDIIHLGLGVDGHMASLVPDDPVLEITDNTVGITDFYQGCRRMTLTLPVLAHARILLWLVTGPDKATMFFKLQHGDKGIPAGRLQHDNSVAFVDRGAVDDESISGTGLLARKNVLVIDVGGSHVKFMDLVHQEYRRFKSGPQLSAGSMVNRVLEQTGDWLYEGVVMGFPGTVKRNKPAREPVHLAPGWVDFDYAAAFGCPVRMINDAAMQAMGSYQGKKMLFLGLGTGLGSAMVLQGNIIPMELAHLPYRHKKTYEDYLGQRGLDRMGKKKWLKHVFKITNLLGAAHQAEEVVLGGGNARLLKKLPANYRVCDNRVAFPGGFKIWQQYLAAEYSEE